MKFVPDELQKENSPCRYIPLNENGESIDYFYRCGTQLETEEALAGWLRSQNAAEGVVTRGSSLLEEFGGKRHIAAPASAWLGSRNCSEQPPDACG